jgi:TonB family protein
VRFPKELSVKHAWVDTASAQDDPIFGWDKRGVVQCDPTPRRMRLIAASRTKAAGADGGASQPYGSALFPLDPKDVDALDSAPKSTSMLLLAKPINPPSFATCSQAFDYAFVRDQVTPEFPTIARGASGVSAVEIAIDADGSLVDAWIWGPSGLQAFDDAAVAAARQSTYRGARAYCTPARGDYLFIVEYQSR